MSEIVVNLTADELETESGMLRNCIRRVSEAKMQEVPCFELRCKLIPSLLFVVFCVGLIGLICWSWMITATFLSWYSIPLQVALACTVMMLALRLKLRMSRDGIEALSRVHKSSMFDRNKRDWDDVHSIRLRRMVASDAVLKRLAVNRGGEEPSFLAKALTFAGVGWLAQGFIVFDFKSGGMMPLPIAGIPDDQLEEFFIYLVKFADPMALNADVMSLQKDVLMGERLCLEMSYTRMWEESLKERFEVTNFVPLPGGHELLDGEVQVLMQLACGGMSSVYLARLRDGRRVVLKELVIPDNRDGSARKKVEELFAREARILARLSHPQIVRVYDHFVEKGRNYLVLDQAHGLTLRQHVQLNGALDEKLVASIGMQLAEVIDYLHNFDPPVIHRDITPDNIVFDPRTNKITLIDFGAATELVSNLTGTMIGKQSYIPAEQLRGKACPGSDIYSVGASLYFLLTGFDPLPISVSRPASRVASVSAALDSLIAEATAQEVEDRIAGARELYNRLKTI
ncbi:MAG: serine/threonine protein kinase [Cyanobacteria bacterium HKST-UBA02]|nr:serine/threonine protein kinase [Cyanobacteria bacterium HKST-UBA02]